MESQMIQVQMENKKSHHLIVPKVYLNQIDQKVEKVLFQKIQYICSKKFLIEKKLIV